MSIFNHTTKMLGREGLAPTNCPVCKTLLANKGWEIIPGGKCFCLACENIFYLDNQKRFRCKFCSRVFTDKQEAETHGITCGMRFEVVNE